MAVGTGARVWMGDRLEEEGTRGARGRRAVRFMVLSFGNCDNGVPSWKSGRGLVWRGVWKEAGGREQRRPECMEITIREDPGQGCGVAELRGMGRDGGQGLGLRSTSL